MLSSMLRYPSDLETCEPFPLLVTATSRIPLSRATYRLCFVMQPREVAF